MAALEKQEQTAAHVNMMTDTVIANLPSDGLRLIMRSLLVSYPEITSAFERGARKYLEQNSTLLLYGQGENAGVESFEKPQRIVRCLIGSGLCFESFSLLSELVNRGKEMVLRKNSHNAAKVQALLTSLDGDIVQAITAAQKALLADNGRELSGAEYKVIQDFYQVLKNCYSSARSAGHDIYNRALLSTASLLRLPLPTELAFNNAYQHNSIAGQIELKETFVLNGQRLPRLFSGLWQLSSSAWGSSTVSGILNQLSRHAQQGYTAFDMADHYGDAEIIFGHFLSSYQHRDTIFTATKYCEFNDIDVTPEVITARVSERCQRLQLSKIDLLQFHWQFYNNEQYIDALQYLADDERVGMIGLCNFDTAHLQSVLDRGIKIYSNQVQFSLIDMRPTEKMGGVCEKHNIKLLTYGTLCGGFLGEKWLGQPEPEMYDTTMTPSHRKYYEMIRLWGGWVLFQGLLRTLKTISTKHGVSIPNVATRWVLDFPYVGAVIVGSRMGISDHTNENSASLGWSLDQKDHDAIEAVLARSQRAKLFQTLGDCGGEYRS